MSHSPSRICSVKKTSLLCKNTGDSMNYGKRIPHHALRIVNIGGSTPPGATKKVSHNVAQGGALMANLT